MPVFPEGLNILGFNVSKTFLVISHCNINELSDLSRTLGGKRSSCLAFDRSQDHSWHV
jgi:hypothetical protein